MKNEHGIVENGDRTGRGRAELGPVGAGEVGASLAGVEVHAQLLDGREPGPRAPRDGWHLRQRAIPEVGDRGLTRAQLARISAHPVSAAPPSALDRVARRRGHGREADIILSAVDASLSPGALAGQCRCALPQCRSSQSPPTRRGSHRSGTSKRSLVARCSKSVHDWNPQQLGLDGKEADCRPGRQRRRLSSSEWKHPPCRLATAVATSIRTSTDLRAAHT
eukprot:2674761-Rhodomonas_salina.2